MALWKRTTQPEVPEAVQEVTHEPALEPKKPEPHRRRSEILKLRLSPDELAHLNEQAAAAGMSRTDYILAATRGPVVVINDIPQLLIELRKQGINLNQAVRLAHQEKSVDLPEIRAAVRQCSAAQAELVALCKRWDIHLRKKEG